MLFQLHCYHHGVHASGCRLTHLARMHPWMQTSQSHADRSLSLDQGASGGVAQRRNGGVCHIKLSIRNAPDGSPEVPPPATSPADRESGGVHGGRVAMFLRVSLPAAEADMAECPQCGAAASKPLLVCSDNYITLLPGMLLPATHGSCHYQDRTLRCRGANCSGFSMFGAAHSTLTRIQLLTFSSATLIDLLLCHLTPPSPRSESRLARVRF